MITCTFEDGISGSKRHVVVDVLVVKNNKVLMVKRAPHMFLEASKWGTIGGFVDRDETIKQAVEREVFEETGYRVHNLELLLIRDNPDRPHEDRQNVSFVYVCEAGEKDGEPDKESTEQRWFDFDTLPPENEIAFDHYQNIQDYLKLKNER